MAGVKGRSGGRRPGAGRPFKTEGFFQEGCTTKVMRVPGYMKDRIETLFRVQAEWIGYQKTKRAGLSAI